MTPARGLKATEPDEQGADRETVAVTNPVAQGAAERTSVVRVRKLWLCLMCDGPIRPGQQARAVILFPGNDIWENKTPMHGRECQECAEKYGRWTT